MTYLTDREVAELLQVSVRTLQRLVARLPVGQGPPTVGRLRRWPADRVRLEAMLALAAQPPPGPAAAKPKQSRPRRVAAVAKRESSSLLDQVRAKEARRG